MQCTLVLVLLWILSVLFYYIYYLLCCSIFFAICWESFFCFQSLFLMMRLCRLALGFALFLLLFLPVCQLFHFRLFPYGLGSIQIYLIWCCGWYLWGSVLFLWLLCCGSFCNFTLWWLVLLLGCQQIYVDFLQKCWCFLWHMLFLFLLLIALLDSCCTFLWLHVQFWFVCFLAHSFW